MSKNVYASAIVTMSKAKEYNATNKRKIESLILRANDANVVAALESNNVDASRFNARALYATEKCVKIVFEATREHLSVADLNENAFVVIKSAILALEANERLTKRDIESAILSEVKVETARKHVVFARAVKISATAQVQQCIDMLKTLKLVKEVARNEFEILDTALMQTFQSKFADVTI